MDQAFLSQVLPFFDSLSPEDRETIAYVSFTQKYKQNEIISDASVGYLCESLILVLSGRLKCVRRDEGQPGMRLYYLFPNDFCVLCTAEPLYGVRIDFRMIADSDDVEILKLPTYVFKDIKKRSKPLNDFMRRQFADRFTDILYLLRERMEGDALKMTATFLLELLAASDDGIIRMTHEEIARDLGIARSGVSASLKRFENAGWINLSRGGIAVLDADALVNPKSL